MDCINLEFCNLSIVDSWLFERVDAVLPIVTLSTFFWLHVQHFNANDWTIQKLFSCVFVCLFAICLPFFHSLGIGILV